MTDNKSESLDSRTTLQEALYRAVCDALVDILDGMSAYDLHAATGIDVEVCEDYKRLANAVART